MVEYLFDCAAASAGKPMLITSTRDVTVITLSLVLTTSWGLIARVILRRRRCSLSFMISLKSATGRISIGPSPYLKPGSCETS